MVVQDPGKRKRERESVCVRVCWIEMFEMEKQEGWVGKRLLRKQKKRGIHKE